MLLIHCFIVILLSAGREHLRLSFKSHPSNNARGMHQTQPFLDAPKLALALVYAPALTSQAPSAQPPLPLEQHTHAHAST